MTTPKPSPVVYLIDDDPNNIAKIRRLCESVGLDVHTFDSPQLFLSELDPADEGCIVADLLLPEMSGLQLHRELRKVSSQLPIILVTGHADASTCRTALQSGVFDFVEKSFDPHDLLGVIRKAIDKNARDSDERRMRDKHRQLLATLSPREREVMLVLVNGLTLKEIATLFKISVQTASKHRSKLFDKLGVSNEVELLKLLYRIDPIPGLHEPVGGIDADPSPGTPPVPGSWPTGTSAGGPGFPEPGTAAAEGSD